MTVPSRQRPPEQAQRPICIIDDDEWVADSKALLETFGFDVLSYRSGCEFLADGRRYGAACLVIDQHTPGMDGLSVVGYLQKEGISVPTILISGRLDMKTGERAASLGVTNVIEKPLAAGRLLDLIQTLFLERN